MPLIFPAAVLTPAGILVYGWTAQSRAHWVWPNVGVGIFGLGSMVAFQCNQTYIVDAYTRYAASAMAAVVVLRSLAGFGFPLFGPALYRALGLGWGNAALAFVSAIVGTVAPVFLWKYGAAIRARSPFAAGG